MIQQNVEGYLVRKKVNRDKSMLADTFLAVNQTAYELIEDTKWCNYPLAAMKFPKEAAKRIASGFKSDRFCTVDVVKIILDCRVEELPKEDK